MRKFYSLFLAMALMVVGGVNVWAQDEGEVVYATLLGTGSSSCGATAGVYTNTVNAEKEHVNNSKFNSTWQGAAYVEFDLSQVDPEMAITKAEFSFTAIGENRRTRSAEVYYVTNPGGTEENDYEDAFSWSAFEEQGTAVNPARTKLADCTFPQTPPTDSECITIDVTDLLKQLQEEEVDRVIFVVTGNAGGGDINGMNDAVAAENLPALAITLADADTQTKYTIVFQDAEGNDLKEAVEYDGTIDDVVTAQDADKVSFITTEEVEDETSETGYVEVQHKWIFVESDPEEITLTDDPEENYIVLKFREAQMFSYSLESSTGFGIASGTAFEGETVTCPFPQYYLDGKTLWQASAINKEYNYSFELTEDEMTATIEYWETDINNVLMFAEAEDLDDNGEGLVVANNGGNANIRCSNSYGAYFTGDYVLATLPKGAYRLHFQVWGNTGVTFAFKAGETPITGPIYTYNGTDNEWGSTLGYIFAWDSDIFTVTEETDIIICAAGSNGKLIDWIYITKEADDITGDYIVNPAYLHEGTDGKADYAGWTYTTDGFKARDYEEPMNLITYSGNAKFEVNQTIQLPSGHYKLAVHAFYRAGSLEDELRKVAAGQELEKYLTMYAEVLGQDKVQQDDKAQRRLPAESQRYEKEIMNLTEDGDEDGFFEETEGADRTSEAYTDDFVWVPNSAVAARLYYMAGHYNNELEFDVYEEGPVTIGLSKQNGLDNDYCPIGSWTLFRLGDIEVEPDIYSITVNETENGTVEADPEAAEGETVVVTAIPDDGYMVDEAYITYLVVDATGVAETVTEELEPTDESHGEFIMPSSDVTITITFKLEGEEVGIKSTAGTANTKVGKHIENNSIVIYRNGKKYNVAGLSIK